MQFVTVVCFEEFYGAEGTKKHVLIMSTDYCCQKCICFFVTKGKSSYKPLKGGSWTEEFIFLKHLQVLCSNYSFTLVFYGHSKYYQGSSVGLLSSCGTMILQPS